MNKLIYNYGNHSLVDVESHKKVTQINKTNSRQYEYKYTYLMPKHLQIGNDFLKLYRKIVVFKTFCTCLIYKTN